MKRKVILVAVCGFYLTILTGQIAAFTVIEDGASHLVNNDIYQDKDVFLDFYIANIPGTHLEIVDGGLIGYDVRAFNNSEVKVSGGSIAVDLWGFGNSTITINGGLIGDDILAYDSSTVTVNGGLIGGELDAYDSGIIYLCGLDFSVDGVPLNFGDSLRNYGTLNLKGDGWRSGIITGTLQDGSALNSEFLIEETTTANIIIIPEPATLLLFGLGGLILRKETI